MGRSFGMGGCSFDMVVRAIVVVCIHDSNNLILFRISNVLSSSFCRDV